jgi:hypothetical protein
MVLCWLREIAKVHFGVKVPQDCILGNFSAVPAGLVVPGISSQDYVLGYSQPSLRDSLAKLNLVLTHPL